MEVLYILGSTRSGTSALRNALVRTRFKGYGEGHLIPIMKDVIESVFKHSKSGLGSATQGNGLSEIKPKQLCSSLVLGYEDYLKRMLRSEYVLDKTPTVVPIRLAPLLNEFHTAPFFLHCSRRHIDNILSKQRKFPGVSLEQHFREWVGCLHAWQIAREALGGNFFEFDFFELSRDPESIAKHIGEYIGFSSEEVGEIKEYLASKTPEKSGVGDLNDFVKLSETGWSDADIEKFHEICGAKRNSFGYGAESYFC